ncbi:hypothetical protein D3C80_860920 [compost metagenome]
MPRIPPINAAEFSGEVVSKNAAFSVPANESLSIMAKPAANSATQQTRNAREMFFGECTGSYVLSVIFILTNTHSCKIRVPLKPSGAILPEIPLPAGCGMKLPGLTTRQQCQKPARNDAQACNQSS